ncbi:GDSL esterase/lipase At4g01130 isoform X2 [Mercurialis annua]|uniref:GDSL esterase/lipase At4g01130 isoform X2 n=1 Tax=Mercurialis annua TaxID=3986 RepID=UPI00215F2E1B|nr:GDSL esterase/lipase At4g01130 isoform X2 [Mercurialis annua]
MMNLRLSSVLFRQLFSVYVLIIAMSSTLSYSECEFEAIFNFGDSNSDTGGFWAAFPAQSGPFGATYFKKPAGRASDGRLTVDFLAQGLGFPYLSPYLQSIGSNFKHGANFATLASTVLLPNTSLFVTGASMLPSPDVFGTSIYTLYIGQNDFTSNLAAIGISGVKQYLPQVVSQIAWSIKELHALGGRTILVLNLAPVGCYPALLAGHLHNSSDIDTFGCLISYNNAVADYNTMLKQALIETRNTLLNASVVYIDMYSLLLELFQHPASHGFKYGTKACCGYGGGAYNFDSQVYCGNTKVINGSKITASACEDPYNYVSWDGIHATEAANKIAAMAILNGSYSDPPFSFHHCRVHPID